MILQRLKEFWERQEDALPRGYQKVFLTKKIVVNTDGTSARVVSLSGERRGTREGRTFVVPREQPRRASSIRARLVNDNPNYALGLAGENDDPGKVAKRHSAYRALLADCAQTTGDDSVGAVLKWVECGGPAKLELGLIDAESDDLLFEVGGQIPTDAPSVRKYWAFDAAGKEATCAVTGKWTTVAKRMPYPITGVPNGQPSGTMLVAVNMAAGESYGLAAALNSPIGAEVAEAVCNGLNRLLSDPKHSLRVRDTVYIFWTAEPSQGFTWDLLNKPDESAVRALIQSARGGGGSLTVEAKDFYFLALSAYTSRIVVRDYHETSLPSVQASLAGWFERLDLVGPDGRPARPPGVFGLAASLYRDPKDIPKHVTVELLRSAILGSPLPRDLLALAVRRNTATQGPFYRQNGKPYDSLQRLALIKAVLSQSPGGDNLSQLNRENPEPAYHCGRLLSVLESIQRVAIPGLNATLTDRHYGAACASPGTIFGNLLKDATSAHLPK